MQIKIWNLGLLGLVLALFGMISNQFRGNNMNMQLSSPAFKNHQAIPSKYTCEGADISPPLIWSNIPPAAQSLVLIVDDPDAPDPAAPERTWVHWVVYDLPVTSKGLAENAAQAALPAGALQGINDWKRADYGGPCPPIGNHRYFFKLYAVDIQLKKTGLNKSEVEDLIMHHVIEQVELIGMYQKNAR